MDDIVGVGGELTAKTALEAYEHGIFPWPDPNYPHMIWASPVNRGILDFNRLHIPKSLRKSQSRYLKTGLWQAQFNTHFQEVIEECSTVPRKGQDGTWITQDMKRVYGELFGQKKIYCISIHENNTLIGGIYGLRLQHYFSAESMFAKKTDASKLALLVLIEKLKSEQLHWIDIQMLSPHMEKLGAHTIPRPEFLDRIGLKVRMSE